MRVCKVSKCESASSKRLHFDTLHIRPFFVPTYKVTCASLLAVNLQPAKINLAFLDARKGEVAWANAQRVRIEEGER
jgi:hypothetical protein